MIKLYFIRHGATEGNLQRRYIGSTDEALCPLGREQIEKLRELQIEADRLFISPMKRCLQSGKILFPEQKAEEISDFRETDFGIFEGKTAEELRDSHEYKDWLDSMCMSPIPGGEAVSDFKERCCRAFERVISDIKDGEAAAFIVHGGVIMAILERFARPKKDFYAYRINNGEYIACDYEAGYINIPAQKGKDERK